MGFDFLSFKFLIVLQKHYSIKYETFSENYLVVFRKKQRKISSGHAPKKN